MTREINHFKAVSRSLMDGGAIPFFPGRALVIGLFARDDTRKGMQRLTHSAPLSYCFISVIYCIALL